MKEKTFVPGPAKVMYRVYLGALVLTLYSGFSLFSPFLSGWRYPWSVGLIRVFNFYMTWVLALTAFVYLYYATLGRPAEWKEPLGIFRILIALLTIWFFLLTYAVHKPYGWLQPMVLWMGGTAKAFVVYDIFLWVMLLVTLIYVYARWARSERFPRLRSRGS